MPPRRNAWPPEGALRIWYDRFAGVYREGVPKLTKGWLPPGIMGMSFEGLMGFLRGVPGPNHSIMDAGAGISTWVLRKAFADVVTVEPEKMSHIAGIVDGLCNRFGLSEARRLADDAILKQAEGLEQAGKHAEAEALLGEPSHAPLVSAKHRMVLGLQNAPVCDYVLFDYGPMAERLWALPDAWVKTKTAMYVDDADDRPANIAYLNDVKRFAEAEGATVTECREAIDVHGRWGVWLHRSSDGVLPAGNNDK